MAVLCRREGARYSLSGFYPPGIKDLLMGAQLPQADFQHSR